MPQTNSNNIDSKSYVIITCGDIVDPEMDRILLREDLDGNKPSKDYIELKPGENILTVEDYPDLKYGFKQVHRDDSTCSSITKIDLSNFDGSEMTTMEDMFSTIEAEIDFGYLDTSKVKDMKYLFSFSKFHYLKPDFNLDSLEEGQPFEDVDNIEILDLTEWNSPKAILHADINVYGVDKLILDGWKLTEKKQASIFYDTYKRSNNYLPKVSMKGCDASTIKWIAEALAPFIDWEAGDTVENHIILDEEFKLTSHKGLVWLMIKNKRAIDSIANNEGKYPLRRKFNFDEIISDYFKEYYQSDEFEEELKRYFKITQSSNGISKILHVERHFNDNVPAPYLEMTDEDYMEKSICFAIVFYYVCLCNYLINKLAGKEVLKAFLKASGWPMVSCGMGGIMTPNHTMKEADLVFERQSENQETAIWYFQEAKPFMKKELDDFFEGKSSSLNEESYHKFCTDFAPHISKFWEQADEEIKEFNFLKK